MRASILGRFLALPRLLRPSLLCLSGMVLLFGMTCEARAAELSVRLEPETIRKDVPTAVVVSFSEAVVTGVAGGAPTNIKLELLDSPTRVYFPWGRNVLGVRPTPVFQSVRFVDESTIHLTIRVDSFVEASWLRLYVQVFTSNGMAKPRTELYLKE